MPLVTVVVPCHNESESLPLFANELAAAVSRLRESHPDVAVDLLIVDDGSDDGTLDVVREMASTAGPFDVKWVSFSRNFGKEAALYAGLVHARGDFVATMDADLQDPPSLLPKMYDMLVASEGRVDSIATRRATRRGEPPVRSFFARMFYRLVNRISSDAELVDGARDFRLMSREMVDALLSMGEYNRFTKGMYEWVGFKSEWIEYDNVERVAGNSNWSFWKLFRYSIEGITGFSTAPLSLASVLGVATCLISFLFLIVIVVRAALFGDPVAGWPSMIAVILLLGGLQLLCLGIMGQYLAKTYLETKGRPLYIVKDSDV